MSSPTQLSTIDQAFAAIEPGLQALDYPQAPQSLYGPIRYTLGDAGKRIRPKLAILGCALCGGAPADALRAGWAMELLHNFTLIHDDIMDNAETRRGKPTVYRQWGVPLAILSGDMAFGLAYEQLAWYASDDRFTKRQFAELMGHFGRAVREVCEGQAMDLDFETASDVTLDDYLEMIRKKTAALLTASLLMGGAVAGADDVQSGHLNHLGTQAGLAFQIQDDLLDATADPKRFGKAVGGDIREGKKTWLMIQALEQASGVDRQLLDDIVGTKSADDTQIREVVRLYGRLGLLQQAEQEIGHRYGLAMQHLGEFADTPYYPTAKRLFDALIQRDS